MKQQFLIKTESIKRNAINAIEMIKPDIDRFYVISISEKTRSNEQNAKLHAICSDLEKSGFKWAGEARIMLEWKTLLVSAHQKAQNGDNPIVKGLEGEIVSLRKSTAKMGVKELSSVIEYAVAFCAMNGIRLSDSDFEYAKTW